MSRVIAIRASGPGTGKARICAVVRTQVGKYLAVTSPKPLDNELWFEGVRSSDMMDGIYPIPRRIRVSAPYAVEEA